MYGTHVSVMSVLQLLSSCSAAAQKVLSSYSAAARRDGKVLSNFGARGGWGQGISQGREDARGASTPGVHVTRPDGAQTNGGLRGEQERSTSIV